MEIYRKVDERRRLCLHDDCNDYSESPLGIPFCLKSVKVDIDYDTKIGFRNKKVLSSPRRQC
jgi:hypothetical protein